MHTVTWKIQGRNSLGPGVLSFVSIWNLSTIKHTCTYIVTFSSSCILICSVLKTSLLDLTLLSWQRVCAGVWRWSKLVKSKLHRKTTLEKSPCSLSCITVICKVTVLTNVYNWTNTVPPVPQRSPEEQNNLNHQKTNNSGISSWKTRVKKKKKKSLLLGLDASFGPVLRPRHGISWMHSLTRLELLEAAILESLQNQHDCPHLSMFFIGGLHCMLLQLTASF